MGREPIRQTGLVNLDFWRSIIAGIVVAACGFFGTWLANRVTDGGLIQFLGGVTQKELSDTVKAGIAASEVATKKELSETVKAGIAASEVATRSRIDALETKILTANDIQKIIDERGKQRCTIIGTWYCGGGVVI